MINSIDIINHVLNFLMGCFPYFCMMFARSNQKNDGSIAGLLRQRSVTAVFYRHCDLMNHSMRANPYVELFQPDVRHPAFSDNIHTAIEFLASASSCL
jgi:hypothetical protein